MTLEHGLRTIGIGIFGKVDDVKRDCGDPAAFFFLYLAGAFADAADALKAEREAREAAVARRDGDVTYHPKGKP